MCGDFYGERHARNYELNNETDNLFAESMCGRIQSPSIVLSTGFEPTNIIFKTDNSITDRGFNLTYSYSNCGGVLTGPYHDIRSSGSNQDCVWLLDFQEGQQIVLSQFNMQLDNSQTVQCGERGASYIKIRNGGEPDAPILWTGCGNTEVPSAAIRSMSNKLWIQSHLEGILIQDSIFSIL